MRRILIDVPERCGADWDSLEGSGRARACSACSKTVHDIALFTADEAASLLGGEGELPCVRLTLDAQARVVTKAARPGAVVAALLVAPALATAAVAQSVDGAPAAASGVSAQPGGTSEIIVGGAVRISRHHRHRQFGSEAQPGRTGDAAPSPTTVDQGSTRQSDTSPSAT